MSGICQGLALALSVNKVREYCKLYVKFLPIKNVCSKGGENKSHKK